MENFADGSFVAVVDFDWSGVDGGSNESPSDPEKMAEVFRRILDWVWRTPKRQRIPRAALARMMAMTAVIDSRYFDDATYEELGKRIGVRKTQISKLAVDFQDEFKIHFRRSRMEESRKSFRRKK